MKNKVVRYIVKANDRIVDWSFSKKEAERIAFQFEYECLNQDDPFAPKMEIVEEIEYGIEKIGICY